MPDEMSTYPSISPFPLIHDIRKCDELLDLKSAVLSGLRGQPKFMPSLVLWDEQGLEKFDEWTQSPDYYPLQRELDILHHHKADIARQLPEEFAMIELGSG